MGAAEVMAVRRRRRRGERRSFIVNDSRKSFLINFERVLLSSVLE